MTEQEFTDVVIELAGYTGWLAHHDRPARTARGYRTAIQGDAGFPDLVLVAPRVNWQPVYLELKGDRGKLSNEQKRWLWALENTGAQVAVCYPRDLPAITDLLQFKILWETFKERVTWQSFSQ